MKYMSKSIEELHELLINGEVTSDELVKESIELSHEVNDKYNAFAEKGSVISDNEIAKKLLEILNS